MTEATTPGHEVVAVGSAIVDVISHTDDEFLERHAMPKGAMRLIESEEEADLLYDAMGPAIEISGGSAANTVAGVASFGGRAGFIGRVRGDQLGQVFAHDIRAVGVTFTTPPAEAGPPTARSLILVTPDAQRTMNTYLGIAGHLGTEDLDRELLGDAAVVYCEGYLWDLPDAKAAIVEAMDLAHARGNKVAFTLSDPFCVDRHRQEFRSLVRDRVDLLFANEVEITSLYEVDTFEEAQARVRGCCEVVCLTRSEKGSVILTGDDLHRVAAHPVDEVVDTTGAGDLYAAGVLFGYARGWDLATAGRLGSLAAAEVIGSVGARPERPLAELLELLG